MSRLPETSRHPFEKVRYKGHWPNTSETHAYSTRLQAKHRSHASGRADPHVRSTAQTRTVLRRPQQVHIACRPQSFAELQPLATLTNVMPQRCACLSRQCGCHSLDRGKVVRLLSPYLVQYKAAASPATCTPGHILSTTSPALPAVLTQSLFILFVRFQARLSHRVPLFNEQRLPTLLLQKLLRPPWTAPIRVI